jgi:serine/threonine-protein kinase
LVADGLSVWWDAHIGGGSDWRESIAQNLERAKCVVVVWSRRSVGPNGRFVRDEATRAQRNGTYLPVRIDKVELPLGFGETQAISLIHWDGAGGDDRCRAIVTAVRAVMAGTHVPSRHVEDDEEQPAGVSRRGAMLAGGAVAAAAIGGFLWLKPGSAAARSIAVLPFANLSGDPAQAYFADGIAEELRAVLARIPDLKVMARTSSEKVRDDDAQTAAGKLKVDTILTGSVRRSPETIRINAQLVEGKSGLERWSDAYDRPAGDALSVQTEIAAKVADALRVELGGAANHSAASGRSGDPQAQDRYLKGKTVWQGNPTADRLKQAIALFDQAIARDPKFADAYAQKSVAMLVYTQTFAANSGEHQRDVAAAEAAARKALSIAPGLPSAYAALAIARSARFDFTGALADFKTAFADSANASDLVAEYARFLASIGQEQAAKDWADRGIDADPLNPRAHQSNIYALYCDRQYDAAIGAAEGLLRWSPGRSSTLSRLGDCLILTGKLDSAAAAYGRADPDYPPRILGEAIIAARRGDRAASDQALARIQARFGDMGDYRAAQVQSQRGDMTAALAALARAIVVKDPGVIALPTDPWIDPLRGQPRFAALLKGLGFPA